MGELRGTSLILHLVVPGALEQRTGGYRYDARMVQELRGRGWQVTVHELPGRYPPALADPTSGLTPEVAHLDTLLAGLPDDALVVLDGLAMGGMPDPGPLSRHAGRLRLVSLVHHLLGHETGLSPGRKAELEAREARVLHRCRGILTTSPHTAAVVAALGLAPSRIRVVLPGTERPGAPAPDRRAAAPDRGPVTLLTVGSIVPRKGHDVLVEALARLDGDASGPRGWRLEVVGSLDRDPACVAALRRALRSAGLEDRVRLHGERSEDALEAAYRSADLFVLPSHHEGYGMVLAEALARGLPVVSTTAGAIPDTVDPGALHGVDSDAVRLVPPGDSEALARALAAALASQEDPARRHRARAEALERARRLPTWEETAAEMEAALVALGALPVPEEAGPAPHAIFSADWLAKREPADHRSRDPALVEAVVQAVVAREGGGKVPAPEVVDLGSGTGSNLRYLAPRFRSALPGGARPRWILVDHDEALVAPLALLEGVTPVVGDLRDAGIEAVRGADVVTASALLDLVSRSWLAVLVEACTRARGGQGAVALFALTYDGTQRWTPEDPDDALVLEALNAHQRLDKGLGPALGPEATTVASALFRACGYEVRTRPSPWILGPGDETLVHPLVTGWVEAVSELHPELATRMEAWGQRRLAWLKRGESWSLEVGHQDLLALPPGRSERVG